MWPALGMTTNSALGIAAAIACISAGGTDRVLVADDDQRRHFDLRQQAGHVGPGGHAALSGGDRGGRRAFHNAADAATISGCVSNVLAANSLGPIISATRPLPHSATFSAILIRPARASSVSATARVSALHECPQALGVLAHELPGDVAAHREADEHDRLANFSASSSSARSSAYCSIEMPRCRVDMAEWRLAEAAQVGSDHASSARRALDLRVPHRVVEREAVDEEDGCAGAAVDVGEFDGGEVGAFS